MEKMNKVVFGNDYTNITVIQKNILFNGIPRTVYNVKLGDNVFPGFFDNISFHDNEITVFTFTGSVYAGADKKLSFEIEKYPNGVVRANIRVCKIDINKKNREIDIDISYTTEEVQDHTDLGGDIERDIIDHYESFTNLEIAYKRFEEILGMRNARSITLFCWTGWD